MLAPICLFTYNRLEETKLTIEALKSNFLAKESDLIIFSDGAKTDLAKIKVLDVRQYLHTVTGFKSVSINEGEVNKGLAASVIDGVTSVLATYGKVIVLEDDLISSPNFLDFMNQALAFYQENPKVYCVTGYTMNLPSLKRTEKDYYLSYRASSWGWATWQDRWGDIDWELSDYKLNRSNLIKQFKFRKGGADLPLMLWKQMNGYINSWAVRWCYHQFTTGSFCVHPTKNMIMSVGSGEDATHTKKMPRRLINSLSKESNRKFQFESLLHLDKIIVKEFRSKFSTLNRLIERLS